MLFNQEKKLIKFFPFDIHEKDSVNKNGNVDWVRVLGINRTGIIVCDIAVFLTS
jgi:hypothetical protein